MVMPLFVSLCVLAPDASIVVQSACDVLLTLHSNVIVSVPESVMLKPSEDGARVSHGFSPSTQWQSVFLRSPWALSAQPIM